MDTGQASDDLKIGLAFGDNIMFGLGLQAAACIGLAEARKQFACGILQQPVHHWHAPSTKNPLYEDLEY